MVLTEITKITGMSRRAFFKRSARQLLFSDWVNHIFAFLIVAAFFAGINQIGICMESLVFTITSGRAVATLFSSLYFVVSFAVIIPMLYGLVRFEINAVNGKSDISDIFSAFRSFENLNRSYVLFFYLIFKTVLYFVPFFAGWCFLYMFYFNGIFGVTVTVYNVDVIRIAVSAVLVLCFYFGFVMSAKHFVGVYVCVVREETPVRACFLVSANCNYMSRGELAFVMLSFVPLCIVSMFTAGLLYILYTVPYMLLTMTMISKYVVEAEMNSKSASEIMYENIDDNINENINEKINENDNVE